MEKRKAGNQGLEVSAIGLGCMGMSFAYGSADDRESIKVLRRALELGINFWDTAEVYGPFKNEELLGRVLKEIPRENVIIATKFAWRFNEKGERTVLDSSPGHIKRTIEGSLKRLGTDYIDLYYQHRLDTLTPIEDTAGALSDLVREGKVRYIGLSEVGPGTIKRANAVHPVSVVQSEYSLWERNLEKKVIPVLRELGIGLVAYSPLGRGFLTGRFKNTDELEESDWRRTLPRLQGDNLKHNLKLVEIIKKIALENHSTPGQIALAWLLRQGDDIIPIPGTKHISYLEENAASVELSLPDSVWYYLDKEISSFESSGIRYPEEMMKYLDSTE